MESEEEHPVNYSPCLICSSLIITPEIKTEPDPDQEEDNKSVITFVLKTLLEIPEDKVRQHEEKLVTAVQLMTASCDHCIKLICSARTIYTEIVELCRTFREVQKQIVEQICKSGDLQHSDSGIKLSASNYNGLLDFCRKFLNKHDFNGFRYPLVVNEIPLENDCPSSPSPSSKSSDCQEEDPLVDKVKEEPISENEGDASDNDQDEDNLQNTATSSSFSASGDSQNESESEEEKPPPPPPKVAAARPPPKPQSPSGLPLHVKMTLARKKRIAAKLAANPLLANKLGIMKPLSKFERLHPTYPKLLPNPTTNKFHCSEPSCSKVYPRKAGLERHVLIDHFQDNFYKCEEPFCGKSFANPEIYQDHVSWHAGIPRWKCEEKVTPTTSDGIITTTLQCTEAFFCRKKLNRHVQQVHRVDNPIICELCGKRVSCQEYLSTHKYFQHNKAVEKQHSTTGKDPGGDETSMQICNYCGKTFKLKHVLDTHINLIHETTEGKFGCQFCERKFNKKIWLKQHLWSKHDKFSLEGYHPPPPPPKKVKEGPAKKNGRPPSAEPKPKSKLKYWLNKPFQCKVKGCKLGYRREQNLKKHVEEKHGGKEEGSPTYFQFLCKFCGKGFHIKFKKDMHEEAHENKESKPFSCEICGKKFAVMHYLKMHWKNIHKSGDNDEIAGAEDATNSNE